MGTDAFDPDAYLAQSKDHQAGTPPSNVPALVIGASVALLVVMLLAAGVRRWVRPRAIHRAATTYLAVGWRRLTIVAATGVAVWRWVSIDSDLGEYQSALFDAPESVLAQCLVLPIAMVVATDWVVAGFRRPTPPAP